MVQTEGTVQIYECDELQFNKKKDLGEKFVNELKLLPDFGIGRTEVHYGHEAHGSCELGWGGWYWYLTRTSTIDVNFLWWSWKRRERNTLLKVCVRKTYKWNGCFDVQLYDPKIKNSVESLLEEYARIYNLRASLNLCYKKEDG